MLFVNKLTYLTLLTNAENITDREVEILLGDQPTIDGLYFSKSQVMQVAARSCTVIQWAISLRTVRSLRDSASDGSSTSPTA